jgi:uncharacterized membrane protein (DUF2068 family)
VRWIAVYKLVVGVLLVAVGVELFRFLGGEMMDVVHDWILELHADPHHPWIAAAFARAGALEVRQLRDFAWVSVLLGSLHGAEGVGLWLRRRWAESLCIVSTASLLPMEIHELLAKPGAVRVAVLGVNLAVLGILVARSVGARGSRAAADA